MAYPPTTAVSQFDYGWVDVVVKHLYQLGAVLVHPRRLLVVEPGILKHQPHVIAELASRERERERERFR